MMQHEMKNVGQKENKEHKKVPLHKGLWQGGQEVVDPQLWRNFLKSAQLEHNFALCWTKMLVHNGLCVGQLPRFFLPVPL